MTNAHIPSDGLDRGQPLDGERLRPRHEGRRAGLPQAIILAAGRGSRFTASGGAIFKQLFPYEGTPVITRLVRQVAETGLFSGTTVVLGSDVECAAAIRQELSPFGVTFVTNPDSDRDNNLLSLLHGTAGLDAGALVIEADCIVEANDLAALATSVGSNEIRWANIGPLDRFTYGGVVEFDGCADRVIGVCVLDEEAFSGFVRSGRSGVKLFGLTMFGAEALALYREKIQALPDKYGKYFHYIAQRYGNDFTHTTYRVSRNSFSFNTVAEIEA